MFKKSIQNYEKNWSTTFNRQTDIGKRFFGLPQQIDDPE